MNAAGRKVIDAAISQLEELKSLIEELAQEERGKFDNMTEGLQASERGQAIEQSAMELEEVDGHMQSAIDCLENAKGA